MKSNKIILTVLLFLCVFSLEAIPNPMKGKGAVIAQFYVKMGGKFYNINKGLYKDGVEVIIYNTKTGKKYNTYTSGGYLVFFNVEPGEYVIPYWKLAQSGGDSQTTYGENIDDRVIQFTVKPGVVTVLGSIKSEVVFNGEIQEYSGSWSGEIDTTQKSTVKKDEEMINKLVEYFKSADKRNKWTAFVYE